LAVIAVYIVIDGDIAYMMPGKVDLDVTAGLDIVSAQAAEILGYHAPDLASFDIIDHALETGAVEVTAGITVIDIESIVKKAILLSVIAEHGFLIADGHTFIVPAIFKGKAAVKRRDERGR